MKLLNFYTDDGIHVGIKKDEGIIDATAAGIGSRMEDIIANWDIASGLLYRMYENRFLPMLQEDDITFAPTVSGSGKILCSGLNYRGHVDETSKKTEKDYPAFPVIFSKFGDALSAHNETVSLPIHTFRCFDYEAELVIVIGKTAYNVTEERAGEYIFGYTCGNDLSIRDAQFVSGQWLIGKTHPGFAPVGPYVVTADEIDPCDLDITCRRNGITVQSGCTSDMLFSPSRLVSYCSRHIRLEPGDIIFTGTPEGVILGKEKGKRDWLAPGEEVVVTISKIGSLRTILG